jgi:hypothetical protein
VCRKAVGALSRLPRFRIRSTVNGVRGRWGEMRWRGKEIPKASIRRRRLLRDRGRHHHHQQTRLLLANHRQHLHALLTTLWLSFFRLSLQRLPRRIIRIQRSLLLRRQGLGIINWIPVSSSSNRHPPEVRYITRPTAAPAVEIIQVRCTVSTQAKGIYL